MNDMIINGQKAKHVGFVGFHSPWKAEEMDIFDDIWGTPDGKRYVERYLQGDIVEYDWVKHGYIWTDGECHKASMGLPVYTLFPQYKSDKAYEDWCLQNNFAKLDEEAGRFVLGDDVFDDEFPWDYCPLFADYNECGDNKDCPYTGCPLHD